METTVSLKKAAYWVDIHKPQKKHLEWLAREFKVHPVILEELQKPSARAVTEVYDDYIFFIYYFPQYDSKEETSRPTEIDFIITRNHVVTVHYEEAEIEALRHLTVEKDITPLRLFYKIVRALLEFEERQLQHIREKVETIGKELFENKEKDILRRISRLKRDISEYRIIVRHQGPILESFAEKALPFLGTMADEPYLRDLVGDHMKIMYQLDDYREAISDFEETNTQLMNVKTNNVMKTFTVLSFLTFPFVLLTGIFEMRLPGQPLEHVPGAFWIVVGFMLLAIGGLAWYFRKKDWF